MKTKQVPVIITLVAGLITCILGFTMHMEAARFVRTLVLGCIAKLVLDKNFKEEPEEEATEEAGEESDMEKDGSLDEMTDESEERFAEK